MTFEPGLDTTSYGDRFALRDHGKWLTGTYLDKVKASRDDLSSVLADTIDWYGDAGQNFKIDTAKWMHELEKLAAAAKGIDKAEDALADALEKVSDKLVAAETGAREAGLTVTMGANSADKIESYILPPNEPTSPEAVIDKYRQKPRDWVKSHEKQVEKEYQDAVTADREYGRKLNAFNLAKAKVEQARKDEQSAHAEFRKALGEAIAPVAEAYSLAKFGTNVALSSVSGAQDASGMLTKKADALRLLAQEMYGAAEAQEKTYIGKHLSDADKARVAAWIQYRTAAQGSLLDEAGKYGIRAQSIDKWLNQVPVELRQAIEKNPSHFLEHLAYTEKPGKHRGVGRYEKAARLILKNKNAVKVLRGVPLVGTSFTVLTGVGDVVILGEDPAKVVTKSVAGTLASMAGGAGAGLVATGFGLGGPITVVAVVAGGISAGMGSDALIDAMWQEDLDDFELRVYRDEGSNEYYKENN